MIVYHCPDHSGHAPAHQFDGGGHVIEPYPEVPGRIDAILRALGTLAELRQAPACSDDALLAVHDAGMLEVLREAYTRHRAETGRIGPVVPDTMNLGRGPRPAGGSPRRPPRALLGRLGWYAFDAQTPITEGTWQAARGAASCAIAAAAAVAAGAPLAYAAIRPPGHHAGPDFYGGYGFLNNAALAARALLPSRDRVAILDVDYHHGNGTQEVFYEDPHVLYVSLHADPDHAYPYYWGRADETGAGPGVGSTRNFPLPLGTAEPEYLAALDQAIATVRAFAPGALVVSLGTDVYEGDPVGTFALSFGAFARIGERMARLRLPTVVVNEGGYSLSGIGTCVRRFFDGLSG
jgi:acetoin utilization deacetylase AcuC-like enzyme